MAYPGEHAKTRPNHPAIIMAGSGETLTYRQLDERSNQLAHLLRASGLEPGDHLAVFMENQIRFMEVIWAAFRSGLYVTTVNSFLTGEEVAYIVDDCDARVLVSSRALSDVATGISASSTPKVERRLMIDGVVGAEPHDGHNQLQAPVWESYEEAVASYPTTAIPDEAPGTTMLYSSGTTGRPKGIVRPLPGNRMDEMVPKTADYFTSRYSYGPDMVYLSPAPLYHAAPLAFSQIVHRFGGTLVVMERFDAAACLENIERYSVTHAQFVPTMFVRMLKLPDAARQRNNLSSLEIAIHASAPCPAAIKYRMIDWWGPVLKEYYAGSEGNGTTTITSEEWLERPGSVGRARQGRIHICDDDGNDLPPGEVGTVYFSGGGQYRYHKAPDKTAEAALPGGRTTLGDIGYLDEDGYLYLTDRKAHMIISGGVNIYPQEVEDLLIAHPAVADVAVFGVPDEEMGQQVKAAVQTADGREPSDELAAELISFTRANLANYKCPKSVDFETELPRLPTGKLYKRLLQDRYTAT